MCIDRRPNKKCSLDIGIHTYLYIHKSVCTASTGVSEYIRHAHRFHAPNTNWEMGSLSAASNVIAVVLSLHTGNVKQNQKVTQQYPTTLVATSAHDPPALPGLSLIPAWRSNRFPVKMTKSSKVMATA